MKASGGVGIAAPTRPSRRRTRNRRRFRTLKSAAQNDQPAWLLSLHRALQTVLRQKSWCPRPCVAAQLAERARERVDAVRASSKPSVQRSARTESSWSPSSVTVTALGPADSGPADHVHRGARGRRFRRAEGTPPPRARGSARRGRRPRPGSGGACVHLEWVPSFLDFARPSPGGRRPGRHAAAREHQHRGETGGSRGTKRRMPPFYLIASERRLRSAPCAYAILGARGALRPGQAPTMPQMPSDEERGRRENKNEPRESSSVKRSAASLATSPRSRMKPPRSPPCGSRKTGWKSGCAWCPGRRQIPVKNCRSPR